jgi:hypothetical protein
MFSENVVVTSLVVLTTGHYNAFIGVSVSPYFLQLPTIKSMICFKVRVQEMNDLSMYMIPQSRCDWMAP